MKVYELTYIISPEMNSEEISGKVKEIETAIQSRQGVIIKQSVPTARTLSYPIGKRASGFWGYLEFQAEPEKLIELEGLVAKDGKIVRHMISIKKSTEPKQARRSRMGMRAKIQAPNLAPETKYETETSKEESADVKEPNKEKVELKDIEHELDEILGE